MDMDLPQYLFEVMLPFCLVQQELLVNISLTKVLQDMHASMHEISTMQSLLSSETEASRNRWM